MIAVNKILKVLREKDVGSIGIGAMIVFIAMVLVAGIAASVLVQTANRLETQAMETGEETTAEVATGIRVCDMEGYYSNRSMKYNTTNNVQALNDSHNDGWHNYSRLHNMTITVAPRAGSSEIDLQQTVVELSNSSVKVLLTYDSGQFASAVGTSGVFSTSVFDLGPDDFGLIVLEDADTSISSSTDAVINRGDKVMLTVNLSICFWGLSERTDVWGQVIPEEGSTGIFAFRTPAAYTDTVYDLY